MSLGKKITFSFSIIILLIIGIVGVIWFQLGKIEHETQNIVTDAIPLSNAANNILTELVNQETGIRGYLVTGDEAFLEPYYLGQTEIENNLSIINEHLDGHPIMASLIEEAKPKIEQIQIFFESEIALVKQGDIEEARNRMDDGKAFFDSYRETHELIVEDTGKLTNDAWINVKDAHSQSILLTLTMTAVILILIALISVYLIRNISRPISQISQSLGEIASGNLSIPEVKVRTKDEVGELARALNKMTADLTNTITRTQESAMQVAASSEELTASAEQSTEANEILAHLVQDNYKGAEDQLSQTNSVSKSIDEMNQNINTIADSSKEMEQFTISTTNQVEDGMTSIDNVVEKINDIQSSFENMDVTIQSLNTHSNEIGSILNLITDISEQTNLLALNAAIEAARAGEHGRGFAIVADEVRVLAEESKRSADQIAEMVTDIQNETQNVVVSISDGNITVQEGISSTVEAKDAFNQIKGSMEEVANKVGEVSSSILDIEKISLSITEELDNVQEIAENSVESNQESSASTQEQLATMEEISSAAESLASLAEDLQHVISHFQIR